MQSLKIKANAKINLSLSVLGKRFDGYHELDTVMQSISLNDTVYIEKSDKITVECGELGGEDNIAFKAAAAFFKASGINAGAKIKIEKRIPSAAGMGGGSADAAAVLVGLDKLYEAELSYERLLSVAVKLGADVPFLIRGGTARAKGIGEILEPLKPIGGCYFLIAKGENKPSTGEMFRRLDSAKYNKPDIEKTVSALNSGDVSAVFSSLDNSFSALWQESHVKAELLKTDADGVSLSGSGPAWFAVYRDKEKAVAAEKALKALRIPVFICEPQNKSLIFE
ncbi:MAG: 4-(cytidine 5'-diphospho)-2-C-methyl-D-erythritol kinase [Acutalibacteraceae bacterium]|nr:4-(cytidine 5'-diphospho)-2-C-methyl-D-erythritol kinase [Acutalibacteraceae bacterium]